MQEIWREIPGWEGYYSVSNFGRVRSESRTITTSGAHQKTYKVKEMILKQTLNNVGHKYWRVSLSRNSKVTYRQVHQLVCAAFIGPQAKGIEVRHLNGDCRDNRLENLTYGSKADNMQDAIKHGTFPQHENRPGAKLTKQKAIDIVMSKKTLQELAKEYQVHWLTIRQVKVGVNWGDVTKEARLLNPYKTRKNKKL